MKKILCIISPIITPSNSLMNIPINDIESLQFIELFGSAIISNSIQDIIYKKAIQSIRDKNPNINLVYRGEINPILDNTMLMQISNIVYPVKQITDDTDISEFYGEKGLKNLMSIKNNVFGRLGLQTSSKEYTYKDNSIVLKANQETGSVFKVYTGRNGDGYKFCKVQLKNERYPTPFSPGLLVLPIHCNTIFLANGKIW